MSRRVSVRLELEVSQYMREGRQVLAVTKATSSAIDDLGDEADSASRDMAQLAANTDIAKHQIDDLGDEAKGAAADLALLGHELDSVDRKAGSLGGSVVKSGGGLGLAEIGQSVRGAMIPIAGAAIVGALPMIGTAVAAVVAGGAGLGGVIGGIVLASKSPEVKAAWGIVGEEMSISLTRSAEGFIQPLVRGAHEIATEWATTLGPTMDRVFANLSNSVAPLVDGVRGFEREIGPGLEALSRAAGPILTELGNDLPGLAASITDFSESIESATPGARRFFSDLMDFVGGSIELFGEFAQVSAWLYDKTSWNTFGEGVRLVNENILHTKGAVVGVLAEVHRGFDAAKGWQDALSQSATDALVTAAANQALTASFQAAITAAEGLTTAWDILHGNQLTADESLLAAKKAVDDLGQSFKDNKGKIDGNSEAALENRIAMAEAGRAASDAAQKYFDATGDIDGARKIMRDQQKAAEDAAVANGGNATAVHDLAGEMFKVPKNVKSTITVAGTQTAKAAVDALVTSISHVLSKSVTITTRMATIQTGAIPSARAEGGPVEPGVPYRINERGFETVTFPAYGQVHPANLTPAMAWNSGNGGGNITVTLAGAATPFERALLESMRRMTWTAGGGSVQVAAGRS